MQMLVALSGVLHLGLSFDANAINPSRLYSSIPKHFKCLNVGRGSSLEVQFKIDPLSENETTLYPTAKEITVEGRPYSYTGNRIQIEENRISFYTSDYALKYLMTLISQDSKVIHLRIDSDYRPVKIDCEIIDDENLKTAPTYDEDPF